MQSTNTFAHMTSRYSPETYWDTVAEQIGKRKEGRFIAGDNDPYYQYKRRKFLNLLKSIPFKEKRVLEVGSGPGGNLLEVFKLEPYELTGADVSEQMLILSNQIIGEKNILLVKTDGHHLPFADKTYDIVFTSTVLQHITDRTMLSAVINEMCRVSKADIYIFERIEKKHKEKESNAGRTISEYDTIFNSGFFALKETKFLHIYWSRLACGIIRKIFNNKKGEGETQSVVSVFLQKCVLPVTKLLDNLFRVKKDLAMLHFQSVNSGK